MAEWGRCGRNGQPEDVLLGASSVGSSAAVPSQHAGSGERVDDGQAHEVVPAAPAESRGPSEAIVQGRRLLDGQQQRQERLAHGVHTN